MTLSETAPLRPADDDEIVDTEACCAVSPVPAATRSPVVRRAVLASAVMLALAGSVFAARANPTMLAVRQNKPSKINYLCLSTASCLVGGPRVVLHQIRTFVFPASVFFATKKVRQGLLVVLIVILVAAVFRNESSLGRH